MGKQSNNQFEWNGTTFVVRARTAFDESLYNAVLVDVANVIAKAHKTTIEELPNVLDRLASQYVMWAQVTTANDDVPFLGSLYPFSGAETFDAFVEEVTHCPELWQVWQDAYNAVNKEQSDPQPESGA